MCNNYINKDLKFKSKLKIMDVSSFENSKSTVKQIKMNYLHIEKESYIFIQNYYKNYIIKKYKELSLIDNFLNDNSLKCYDLKTNDDFFKNKILEFNLNLNQNIKLNAFESINTFSYEIINLCDQILSLDWSYTNCLLDDKFQYLAISTQSNDNLLDIINNNNNEKEQIVEDNNLNKSNLIYFYKFESKIINDNNNETINSLNNGNLFAILNRNLGNSYCLKWRPDCGIMTRSNQNLLGYLLVTSTNGYAYIYLIKNLFKNKTISKNSINIYEPTKQVRLKVCNNLYGQCTTGDWCQLNGATKIALGYTNGAVVLFDLDNEFYYEIDGKIAEILPYKCINAHLTFVKTLKWSKTNEYLLASGSSFSRELKFVSLDKNFFFFLKFNYLFSRVWNLINTDKCVVDYEIFITELAFSIHISDIFMTRESNLK